MGGEKQNSSSSGASLPGSLPHGRGKEASIFDDGQRLGITPALAGKSLSPASCRCHRGDHPRMGGEKYRGAPAAILPPGSPPRGRGKDVTGVEDHRNVRITPAWAGKRLLPSLRDTRGWDHPRTGGEKSGSRTRWMSTLGSPPHGRGKVFRLFVLCLLGRITPA